MQNLRENCNESEKLQNGMEFRFNLSPLFKTEIIRVKDNLLPQGYTGDKRTMLDGVAKMSEVLNDIGEASAQAQGLTKPVTTAQKLRNSDHTVYLLAENNGKNGVVTGLLKVGPKNLYVFDPNGETKMVNAPCVLDFYIHESRQRAGLGKKLFETMLEEEQCAPHKMAIDRPSDKLMGFLRKHYGLEHTIPQMNNFVVYDGFFEQQKNAEPDNSHRMHITSSPNTALFGPHVQSGDGQNGKRSYMRSQQGSPLPCHNNQAAHGRYAAARPVCSMAEIINGGASHVATEPNRHL